MRNTIFLRLFTLVIFTISCNAGTIKERQINDIVRVYWHEKGLYSFDIQKDGSNVLEIVTTDNSCDKFEVKKIIDVPTKNKMWAIERRKDDFGCFIYIEIHLHSPEDVNGAGWNHGKFGSGQTTVVR